MSYCSPFFFSVQATCSLPAGVISAFHFTFRFMVILKTCRAVYNRPGGRWTGIRSLTSTAWFPSVLKPGWTIFRRKTPCRCRPRSKEVFFLPEFPPDLFIPWNFVKRRRARQGRSASRVLGWMLFIRGIKIENVF